MSRYDGTATRRRQPRLKLFQPTTMAVAADMMRVHLLDLSIGGALIHCSTPPAAGAAVRLDWAGRMRTARVVWVNGTRFGIAFSLALHEDQVSDARCAVA